MIPLKEILSINDSFQQKRSLPLNFGDHFLYSHNPVFRAVRDLTLDLDFQYTTQDFCNYTAFHFVSLRKILEHKKIFHVDNVSVLREIEKDRPDYFSDLDLRYFSLFRNPIIHESIHSIADDVIMKRNPVANPSQELALTQLYMAEAFAIATENIGACFIDSEMHHRYYVFNTPEAFSNEDRVETMSQCNSEFGIETTHRLIALSYLFNLCFFDSLGMKLIKSDFKELAPIIKLPKLTQKNKKRIQKIFANSTMYNRFRFVTASTYLRLEGYSPRKAEDLEHFTSIVELFNFDMIELLTTQEPLIRAFDQFIDTIHKTVRERETSKTDAA